MLLFSLLISKCKRIKHNVRNYFPKRVCIIFGNWTNCKCQFPNGFLLLVFSNFLILKLYSFSSCLIRHNMRNEFILHLQLKLYNICCSELLYSLNSCFIYIFVILFRRVRFFIGTSFLIYDFTRYNMPIVKLCFS